MSEQVATGKRIVVGVDGSPTSLAALRWAARQGERTGDRVVAVGCWTWPYMTGLAPVAIDLDLAEITRQTLDQAVATVGETTAQIETVVREGPPAARLLEEAEGAELVVVGSRGHGVVRGMLLGSVSQHVVTQARCPVVVIPPAREK